MPPLTPAGAVVRPAARTRASASAKSLTPHKKSASPKPATRKKPAPRTNSVHYKPPRQKPAASRRKTARKLNAKSKAALAIRQPPPSREADPLARQTGARLAYYTPEFLAEAKRRIETTMQSTMSIAGDLGVHNSVLWRLVRRYGWVRPEGSLRLRGLSPVMRLAAQAEALVVDAPHPNPLPASGEREPTELAAPASVPAPASLGTATIDRLEAAVLKELATVETMRASLRNEPRRPADAERTARTLSVLTETLSKLRRLRLAEQPHQDNAHDDDITDIHEFRRDLARRIEAFVASQPDDECIEDNRDVALETPQP